jgi:rfaE bifunctional protein kinase chain/domain
MIEALLSVLPRLSQSRLVVAGDVILDEYLIGRATRMSREAPVPVLEFEERRLIAGGAGNPAANVAALGAGVRLVGVIGADAEATALRQVLQARGIEISALVVDGSRPTTVKTRIMAQMGLRFPQQVARLDRLSREPISTAIEQRVCAALLEAVQRANALLFSDYQSGMLTTQLVSRMRETLPASLLIAADAQGEFDKYVGIGVVKCNADEAQQYLRRPLKGNDQFAAAARELRERLHLSVGMVITRGGDGVTIADNSGSAHYRAPAITDVYDTVGAGDTMIAVLTLALAAGANLTEAAMLANYASGLVVRRVGNYAPSLEELRGALEQWHS